MEIKRRKGVRGIRIVEHNKRVLWWIVCLIILLAILVIFLRYLGEKEKSKSGENIQIANPASVYCIQNNGTLEIREDAQGGQYGVCILGNGSECDEWKYYRGECT